MRSKSKRKRRSSNSDLVYARIRDGVFDAVMDLWQRRQLENMNLQQKDLAGKMDCSPARVNKALRGPANWTLRTFADFVAALDGEAEIRVRALEDPLAQRPNFDAYADYRDQSGAPVSELGAAGNRLARDHTQQGVAVDA